jgi:hypothetical protein
MAGEANLENKTHYLEFINANLCKLAQFWNISDGRPKWWVPNPEENIDWKLAEERDQKFLETYYR